MKLAAFILVPAAAPTRQEVAASMSDLIVLGGTFKTIEASANSDDNDNRNPHVAALAAGAHAVVFDMHESALEALKDDGEIGLIDATKFAEQGIEAAMHLMHAIGAVAPSYVREVLPNLAPQNPVTPSGWYSAAAAAGMDFSARAAGAGPKVSDADRAVMQAAFDAKPTKIQPL